MSVMRWIIGAACALAAILVLTVLGSWLFLRGSLAQLSGIVRVRGVSDPVSVVRDALGVPNIIGNDRLDVAYATGFVHAQERFFQMDILRRSAAGELAGLIGPGGLTNDRDHRLYRFRARAEATLHVLPESQRRLLEHYTAGVNDGVSSLSSRPFEYALLRTVPRKWQAADTLLVIWSMYFQLQGAQVPRELARGWLNEHATPEELAFLLPTSSAYDAPLDTAGVDSPPALVPQNAPAWFGPASGSNPDTKMTAPAGSNGWALAGSLSKSGAALVENDMHMALALPNVWYRVRFVYRDPKGNAHSIVGVTLPGTPLIVVGSNGQVAWAFTNSFGNYVDVIEIERDASNPLRFKTPAGWEVVSRHEESIAVNHHSRTRIAVLECSYGPIKQVGKRFYAIHWIADDPAAVNLAFIDIEEAGDVSAAQRVANMAGIPALGMIAGDGAGHIGWTIAGVLPSRGSGAVSGFPMKAGDAVTWAGVRAPGQYPHILDPAGGRLWMANNRPLANEPEEVLGDGGWDLGARGTQIRDDIRRIVTADEKDVYEVALDDHALFMSSWRDRALKALNDHGVANYPQRAEFRRLLLEGWTGRASTDSVGYRLARAYLRAVYSQMFGAVDEQLAQFDGASFALANQRWPYVAARLLDTAPPGWLPIGTTWQDLELRATDQAIASLTRNGQPLSAATWGKHNRAGIAHPFAGFIPLIKHWLAAPDDPLPGDDAMPRVAMPGYGATERMVVTPGHEDHGIFNMPGGQSGNPLSPFFLAGHEAWVKGKPTSLLPGPAKYTLILAPN
jgi:penicillin G amidase